MVNILDIERIVNKINPDVTIYQSLDFASDALGGTIVLGEQFDDDFKKVIEQVYNHIGIIPTCSLETFAVLHELGHIETLGHMHEEDLEEKVENYLLQKDVVKTAQTDFDEFYQYTQLEIEQLANDWAVEFMQADPLLVAELDRTMAQYYSTLNSDDIFNGLLFDKLLEVA